MNRFGLGIRGGGGKYIDLATTFTSKRGQYVCLTLVAVGLAIPTFIAALATIDQHPPGIDLQVYVEGGRTVVEGGNIYALEFGSRLKVPLPFTYPPGAAVLATVLGHLPYLVTFTLWTVISAVALAWLITQTFQHVKWLRFGLNHQSSALSIYARWFLLGLLIRIFDPVGAAFAAGQVGVLLLVMVYGSSVAALRYDKGGFLAGIWTGIKLTPGLFIVLILIRRRHRSAVRAICGFTVVFTLGIVLLPVATREYFFQLLWSPDRVGDQKFSMNASVSGVIARLSLPQPMYLVLALAVLIGALFVASRACESGDFGLAVSVVGIAAGLVAPLGWIHHFVWLVPAIGLLIPLVEGKLERNVLIAIVVLPYLRLPIPSSILEDNFMINNIVGSVVTVVAVLAIWLVHRVAVRGTHNAAGEENKSEHEIAGTSLTRVK